MKTKITQNIKSIILALILVAGVGYVSAAWTAPVSAPPICNTGDPGCDAPIHVGGVDQTKTGGITASGLTATTKMVIPVLSSDPATPVSGQIWIKQ